MFTFPHISLGKTSHRVACFKGVGRGNPECGRRGAWTYRWAAITHTVRDRYLLSPFCYKPTLPDTWNKFLSPVQWKNAVNRGFPVDPLLLSHRGLGSRMKAAPWTMPGQKEKKRQKSGAGEGGGAGTDPGRLRAEHTASSKEQFLANRLGYFLFCPLGMLHFG